MPKYTVIIEKAKDNYSAFCPDLPGCIATGDSINETLQNMKEAIEFHLEGLRPDSVPEGTPPRRGGVPDPEGLKSENMPIPPKVTSIYEIEVNI